jgi:hypothetical protein
MMADTASVISRALGVPGGGFIESTARKIIRRMEDDQDAEQAAAAMYR